MSHPEGGLADSMGARAIRHTLTVEREATYREYELLNPSRKRKVEWMPLCPHCGGYHWPRCEKGVDDGLVQGER